MRYLVLLYPTSARTSFRVPLNRERRSEFASTSILHTRMYMYIEQCHDVPRNIPIPSFPIAREQNCCVHMILPRSSHCLLLRRIKTYCMFWSGFVQLTSSGHSQYYYFGWTDVTDCTTVVAWTGKWHFVWDYWGCGLLLFLSWEWFLKIVHFLWYNTNSAQFSFVSFH